MSDTYIQDKHGIEADTEGAGPADCFQVPEETQRQTNACTRQGNQSGPQVVGVLQIITKQTSEKE